MGGWIIQTKAIAAKRALNFNLPFAECVWTTKSEIPKEKPSWISSDSFFYFFFRSSHLAFQGSLESHRGMKNVICRFFLIVLMVTFVQNVAARPNYRLDFFSINFFFIFFSLFFFQSLFYNWFFHSKYFFLKFSQINHLFSNWRKYGFLRLSNLRSPDKHIEKSLSNRNTYVIIGFAVW